MNPQQINALIAEVDTSGRLNDIQRAILSKAVTHIDTKQAYDAVRAVYAHRSTFDLPSFLDALHEQQKLTTGAAQRPWHLDTCPRCQGTGFEQVTAGQGGWVTSGVTRCTNGPRITQRDWERALAAPDLVNGPRTDWVAQRNQALQAYTAGEPDGPEWLHATGLPRLPTCTCPHCQQRSLQSPASQPHSPPTAFGGTPMDQDPRTASETLTGAEHRKAAQ